LTTEDDFGSRDELFWSAATDAEVAHFSRAYVAEIGEFFGRFGGKHFHTFESKIYLPRSPLLCRFPKVIGFNDIF
jgi:hypothetical protein